MDLNQVLETISNEFTELETMRAEIQALREFVSAMEPQESRWSIVVLDRGLVYIGKLTYDDKGHGVITHAANIRRWGTTKGLSELQEGPTENTVLDKCSRAVRFTSSIVTLDASEEGWRHAY